MAAAADLGALGLASFAPAYAQSAGAPTAMSTATLQQMQQELATLKAEAAAARAAEAARAQRIDALARELAAAGGKPVPEMAPAAPAERPSEVAEAPPPSGGKKKSRNFEVYGFAQADYTQDFNRVDPNWDDALRPSRIPTTTGQFGDNGKSIISAKQSRFGINASHDVAGMPLTAKFEFDLFGTGADEGKTTIRLRHFYASWGPVLAGQTNTVFMDIDTFPNTIEYWGPPGMAFVRNPQFRYTYKTGKHEFAVAVEKPSDDIDPGQIREIDPNLGANLRGDESLPDLTAHYRYDDSWGHVQLAGLLRRVGYETVGTRDNTPKGHKTGWGVNFSSNIKTWEKDVLHLSVVRGEGIATYMNDGGTDFAPKGAVGFPRGGGAVPLLGLMFYYDHYWNDEWSSSLGWSETKVYNTSLQAGDAFKVGQYASVNLLYSPDKRLLMGAELLWGQREDKSGSIGNDLRLQISFKYAFSSNDFFR
jgi:hypothetical protein